MAKLQKINDLTKALELLKSITEKTPADFTGWISCHGICNDFEMQINPDGYDINSKNLISLKIKLKEKSDNSEVLLKLTHFAEHGFKNHPDVILANEKAKALRLAEFKKLKAEFGEESEVNNV